MWPPESFESGRDAPVDIAGELALGVLDPETHAAVKAQLATDEALAEAYEAWSLRLAPLALAATPAAPSQDLWPQIRARLSSNDNRAAPLRNSRGWRAIAAGLAVICVGLALTLAAQHLQPAASNGRIDQVAVLVSPDGATRSVAGLDAARTRVRLANGALRAPRGRDLELWLIVGTRAPAPLGVIRARPEGSQAQEFRLPRSSAWPSSTPLTLAVSVEPLGGSPTGKPTGPIIAAGRLAAI